MVSEKYRLPADAKLRWLNLIYIKVLQVGGVLKRKCYPPTTAPLLKFLRTAIFLKIRNYNNEKTYI